MYDTTHKMCLNKSHHLIIGYWITNVHFPKAGQQIHVRGVLGGGRTADTTCTWGAGWWQDSRYDVRGVVAGQQIRRTWGGGRTADTTCTWGGGRTVDTTCTWGAGWWQDSGYDVCVGCWVVAGQRIRHVRGVVAGQ